jgi:hypothetical protein
VAGTVNDSTSVIHSGTTTLAGQLSLIGGTLFANGTLNAASYSQTANNAFVDGTGTINVVGAATWSAGNMQGTGTLNFNGDLTIASDANKVIAGGRVINLLGTTTWSGNTANANNRLRFGVGTINNSGTFVDANAFNSFAENYYNGALVFNNSGIYRKTQNTTSTFEWLLNNTGTLDIQAGTLDLAASSTQASKVLLANSARLLFRAGTHTTAGLSITGAGIVEVSGTYDTSSNVVQTGDLTLAGELRLTGGTLTNSGTLAVPSFVQSDGDSVLTGAGTLNVQGAATWSAGTLRGTGTLNFKGDLAISGDTTKLIFDGRVINLLGTTTWSGNTANANNRLRFGVGIINNSGTFIDANAFNSFAENYYGGALVFNNSGIYRKTQNTSSTVEWQFNTTGTVDVQSGVLGFIANSTSDKGQYQIAKDAELAYLQGVHTWADGTRVAGLGLVSVRSNNSVTGGRLNINGSVQLDHINLGVNGTLGGTGKLTIIGQGSTWSGGLMTGSGTTVIAASADLTLTGNQRKYLGDRTLDNLGTLTEASSGDLLDLEGSAILNNQGSFDILSSTSWRNYQGASGNLVLNNTGRIRCSLATGDFNFFNTTVNNTGTLDISTGRILVNGTALG